MLAKEAALDQSEIPVLSATVAKNQSILPKASFFHGVSGPSFRKSIILLHVMRVQFIEVMSEEDFISTLPEIS